jgi:hypothetical protein
MYLPRSDRRNVKRGGFAFFQIGSPHMFGHVRTPSESGDMFAEWSGK